MGRLQTADTEKGELLQVRRLTTREHRLAARRWQSSWEEAPASGTQNPEGPAEIHHVQGIKGKSREKKNASTQPN